MDSSVNKFSSREVDWASGVTQTSKTVTLDEDSYVIYCQATAKSEDMFFKIDGVDCLAKWYTTNIASGSYYNFFAGYISKGSTIQVGGLVNTSTAGNFKIFKLK